MSLTLEINNLYFDELTFIKMLYENNLNGSLSLTLEINNLYFDKLTFIKCYMKII
jgi:hypothetical protein